MPKTKLARIDLRMTPEEKENLKRARLSAVYLLQLQVHRTTPFPLLQTQNPLPQAPE